MSSVSTSLDGAARRTRPRLVLLATSLGVLIAQIDTSVVNLALRASAPTCGRRQHAAMGRRRL